MTTRKKAAPLPVGTKVRFDIAEGDAVGEAVIRESDFVTGRLYRLDVLSGDSAQAHRNAEGELWVWDSEVTPK